MVLKPHPSFSPPPSNCVIWRYMDLSKLLSLLECQQLFFARSDNFEDPYEGLPSNAQIEMYRKEPPVTAAGTQIDIDSHVVDMPAMQKQLFISCWHMNEFESAAMWKLYLQADDGIALRTDHDSLVSAIEKSPLSSRTSVVKYIDYNTTTFPDFNLFTRFLHKRPSFAHENELRAIVWSGEAGNKETFTTAPDAIMLDIVPQDFIHAIHVSPTSAGWFGKLVEKLVARYGLDVPVIRSELYERPIK